MHLYVDIVSCSNLESIFNDVTVGSQYLHGANEHEIITWTLIIHTQLNLLFCKLKTFVKLYPKEGMGAQVRFK